MIVDLNFIIKKEINKKENTVQRSADADEGFECFSIRCNGELVDGCPGVAKVNKDDVLVKLEIGRSKFFEMGGVF